MDCPDRLIRGLIVIPVLVTAVFLFSACDTIEPKSASPVVHMFSFPSTVGSHWTYNYKYRFEYKLLGEVEERSGKRNWEIISVSSSGNSLTCTIRSTSQDTVHYTQFYPPDIGFIRRDTTYTVHRVSSFPIFITSDTIAVSWHHTMETVRFDSLALTQFLRRVPALKDTVELHRDLKSAFYLSGIGLVKYSGGILAHHKFSEELVLVDSSIK